MNGTKYAFVLTYLSHHGIKGQKWGVRRTKAALARAARKEGRTLSPEAARAKTLAKKHRSELTNEELRFLNDRQNLETNNRRLNPNTLEKGQQRTRAALGVIGTGIAVVNLAKSPAGQAAIRVGRVATLQALKRIGAVHPLA